MDALDRLTKAIDEIEAIVDEMKAEREAAQSEEDIRFRGVCKSLHDYARNAGNIERGQHE